MKRENNNFENSLELNFMGATLKLTNYDPRQLYCIMGFMTFLVLSAFIAGIVTLKV